jgi:hypothetical protein
VLDRFLNSVYARATDFMASNGSGALRFKALVDL